MKFKSLILTISLLVLLSACGSNAAKEPAPTSTQTPAAAELTQVAQTIVVQITQNDPAALTQAAQTLIAQITQSSAETSAPTVEAVSPAEAEPPTPTGPTPLPSTTAIPTMTFTQTVTLSPTATLSPTWIPEDPRNVLIHQVGWSANFTEPADWFTFDNENTSIQMENGELQLVAKNSEYIEVWSLSWPYLSNFYLEYTFVVGAERCISADRYGMVFRAPTPESGYLFGVNCKGEYSLRYWDSVEFTEIVPWAYHEQINTGGGAANRLSVRAEDTSLNLYVNGFLVHTVEDSHGSEGKFGAFIKADLMDNFDVRILEAIYWDLP
ncbi:MAG: hypothetical protein HN413_08250 [Chloroflexi bacterium]|jgi:hypothetical protein|nr:hypothetical protein [Chloroflexota bacterium]